ncbi:hypothetical protein [Yersinia sp. Marseille-Q5920]|uniref:hypothetical protein n=1 Tax=Yersinia TaxID=629 RepID=UPI0022647BCA|nr:hypothetical protein [Yersinia sp. Marseille-Q5920]
MSNRHQYIHMNLLWLMLMVVMGVTGAMAAGGIVPMEVREAEVVMAATLAVAVAVGITVGIIMGQETVTTVAGLNMTKCVNLRRN